MSKLGKIVKDTFKAKKESVMGKLGDAPFDDPMEPWSAKYNSPVRNEEVEELTEDSILYRYIRSKGYSPEHMDFAHRSAFARSNAFKTYKVMHQNKKKVATGGIHDIKRAVKTEEVGELSEISKETVKSYVGKAAYDAAVQDAKKKQIVTGKGSASAPYVAKALETPVRKMANRVKGMVKASDRLKKEEVQLDEAGVGKLMNFIKAKGLDPTSMDGNHKKHYSRSSEYRVFKTVHPDPDEARAKHKERTEKKKPKKKLNEISASGEGGDDWNDKFTDEPFEKIKAKKKIVAKESVDKKDTVTFDIPLLIRVLELARENIKSDMDLHRVVERLINMRDKGMLTMDDYDAIAAIKEEVEAKYGKSYQDAVKRVGQKAAQKPVDMKSLAARMQASYAKDKKQPLKELKKQDDNQEITSSLAREEVEELSELSKGTLASYIQKATRHVAAHSGESRSLRDKADKHQEKADKLANKAKTQSDLDKQQVHQQDANNLRDFADRHSYKSYKREKGIETAADKLAKEEVEELSELSKVTLKSYIKGRGETIHADKRDSNSARNKAADLEYHGKQKDADDWHDEADWLHGRARKGATNVTKAAIKVAKKNEEVVVESMESCACTPKQQAMKSARIIKSLYKKKLKESTYDWEKDDKGNKAPTAKIVVKGGKTMTGKDRDTVEIEPVLKTRPNSARGMKPGV